MKNYYEILEVDKNASKEVIDKAYRTLVKKYHPDLKNSDEKITSENHQTLNLSRRRPLDPFLIIRRK